jgi:hypothetical protein
MKDTSGPIGKTSLRLAPLAIGSWAILATAMGCLLPVPPETIHRIPEQSIQSLEPLKSTRADVLLMLADPTLRGDRDDYFIYRWEEFHGALMFIVGLPLAGVATSSCNSLVIQFLPDGRVARIREFSGEPNPTYAPTFSHEESSKFGSGDCENPRLRQAIEDWLKEGPGPDPPAR